MEDNYKSNIVVFVPETHQYFVNDEERFSVTTALKLLGLGSDYSNVNEDILKAKASYGTLIHEEVELYYKNGLIPFTPEASWIIEALDKQGFKVIASETIVYNDILAGTVDIIAIKDDQIWILDIKNTATRNIPYVTYQTNFYGDMCLMNVERYGVIYPNEETESADIIELEKLNKQVLRLAYNCIAEGKPFQPLNLILNDELNAIRCIDEQIKDYQEEIKRLESTVSEFKALVLDAMIKNCITSCDIGNLHITLKNGYRKSSVDSKKFKSEQPDLYNKYVKYTDVKPSLILTFKEEEKKDER